METITDISKKLAEFESQKIEQILLNKPISNTPPPPRP